MFAATIQTGQVFCMPDVCKTPTPAGPLPIPYPNIAMNMMAVPPVIKVLIANSPAINKGSKIAMSDGDTTGTAGGLISGSFMGKCEFMTCSFKVKVGGKPAIRQLDLAQSNKGNCFGSLLEPSQVKVMFG